MNYSLDFEKLVCWVVDMEEEMFYSVPVDKLYECQLSPQQFRKNRMAQWFSYGYEVVFSYYNDLQKARAESINLMTQKYDFIAFSEKIEEHKKELIKSLSEMMENWQLDFVISNPVFAFITRPFEKKMEDEITFSMYVIGELGTYSSTTLEHLKKYLYELEKEGKNLSKIIYGKLSELEGFPSLDSFGKALIASGNNGKKIYWREVCKPVEALKK